MADPRAANCRAYAVDGAGRVTGVALVVEARPGTHYELVRAELIDEAASQGNTVATCVVLDRAGVQVAAPVLLAWPYPSLTQKAAAGNPHGQHMITNRYDPPAVGPLALYVAGPGVLVDSDVVGGLGLPCGHHVSYRLTWRERGAVEPEEPGEEPDEEPAAGVAVELARIADVLAACARHWGVEV